MVLHQLGFSRVTEHMERISLYRQKGDLLEWSTGYGSDNLMVVTSIKVGVGISYSLKLGDGHVSHASLHGLPLCLCSISSFYYVQVSDFLLWVLCLIYKKNLGAYAKGNTSVIERKTTRFLTATWKHELALAHKANASIGKYQPQGLLNRCVQCSF